MTPAQEREHVWPTYEDVTGVLGSLAVGLFGSSGEAHPTFAVQSRERLESAIALPHQPYYETFADKLAALTRSIACNHGLVDGNKRLAVTVLHSTLLLNDRIWLWSDDDAAAVVLRAARGEDDYRWLSEFIGMFSGPAEGVAEFIAAAGSIEIALRLVRGWQPDIWDVIRNGIEEALADSEAPIHNLLRLITPQQLADNWREAISAVAADGVDEAPLAIQVIVAARRRAILAPE